MTVQVLIGSDICPTAENIPWFANGDAVGIFHDLLDDFKSADLSIVDLECPLTDQDHPIPKRGPCLKAPPSCAQTFRNANIHVLNLANNHILDQGAIGLKDTLEAAMAAGLDTVGAGRNLAEARRILVKDVDGLRIGILGLADHEFSIATAKTYGANPLDLIDFTRQLAAERDKFDYLIVILHSGIEYYQLPSPRLKETCRFLIEQGANAVICQHTHCVGGYEEYRGGYIVYGQGNLIFDYNKIQDRSWTEGVLVRLSIARPKEAKMELVPYVQSRGSIGAYKMETAQGQVLLKEIDERSVYIKDDALLRERWERFCHERRNYYLSTILGHNRILEWLNKHGHLVKYLYTTNGMLGMQSLVCCESHREVLETIFHSKSSDH